MTELLCILGRGIEQVPTTAGLVWRPTRYIQLQSAAGRHTGVRAAGIAPGDGVSQIAGSHANVLAACQFFAESRPQLLVFAAGRPPYLEQYPDPELTEGRMMAASFLRTIPEPGVPVVILAGNRNTRDDVVETAKLAAARGLTGIAIVTVSVHVARTREFVRLAELANLEIRVVAAEELLARRYARRPGCLRALERLQDSAAAKRTAAREQRGIAALRNGTYDSTAR